MNVPWPAGVPAGTVTHTVSRVPLSFATETLIPFVVPVIFGCPVNPVPTMTTETRCPGRIEPMMSLAWRTTGGFAFAVMVRVPAT